MSASLGSSNCPGPHSNDGNVLGPPSNAGHRYLAIVAPVNEVVTLFNAANDDTFKGQTIQALSVALRSAVNEIEDVEWPSEVQEAVRQLVAAIHAASAAADSLIADLSDEAASVFALEVEAMTDASWNLRAALGLPLPGRSFSWK